MKKLLYLVHRIPFPPNKGDKIRSFHLLKYLSAKHEVHLGAFVDDHNDWKHKDELSKLCHSNFLCPLNPGKARIKSIGGFFQNKALSLPYYRDRLMQSWVDDTLRKEGISVVVCFSSVMSQYVIGSQYRHLTRVADFVDIDSDKWRQYSTTKSFPMNLVYRREADRLLGFERMVARNFDRCIFVSGKEADLFRRFAPESADRIDYFNNGVDVSYFSPENVDITPYQGNGRRIVFTGAMDYWANIDAVSWFAGEILPLIRSKVENLEFYIVGLNPSEQVRELEKLPGVLVTGAVPDVRPYLAYADLSVAPLRIARGVQNKVLEAMAMAKPVVLTSAAMEGIEPTDLLAAHIADDPQEFANHCVRLLLANHSPEIGRQARSFIEEAYNWKKNLACMDGFLEAREQ